MSSPTCPLAKTKQTTTTKLQLHSLSNMSRRTSREYQTSLNSPSVLLRWTSFKCQTLVCPKFIVPMSPQDGSLDHFQSSQGLCPIVRIRTSQCQKRCRAQQSGKKKKKKYWATPTAIIIWSAGLEVDVGGRQCHRLPICFLTSDVTNTIRNKNQRTLIVRRAGLSSWWWWWWWWKYEERLEKERKECFVQTASWRNPPSHDSKGKLCLFSCFSQRTKSRQIYDWRQEHVKNLKNVAHTLLFETEHRNWGRALQIQLKKRKNSPCVLRKLCSGDEMYIEIFLFILFGLIF